MAGFTQRLRLSERQKYAVAEAWRQLRIRLALRREPGSAWPMARGGVVVATLIRNGGPFLPHFFEYHDRLGVDRYCFLDTGSTDDGPARILEHPRATLLRCVLPFQQYEPSLRRFHFALFKPPGWVLHMDADECFDFPGSARRSLADLLRYLEAGGRDCMTAHMLDLFPDEALDRVGRERHIRPELHRFYDLSDIERRPHPRGCDYAPGYTPEFLKGGIRRRAFGISPLLTKHPLIAAGAPVVLRDVHRVHGARLADASAVLYHYKFAGDVLAHAEESARLRNYWRDSFEPTALRDTLRRTPGLNLRGPGARTLRDADALIDEGFLGVGPAYAAWAGLPVPR